MRSLRIILLLAGKHLRILSRSRAVLAVIFLPGIVLYTIFTFIFTGPAGRPFRVAVIDQDGTPESHALVDALAQNNVRVILTENEEPDGVPLTAESAQEFIRARGEYRVAIVIPPGYSKAPNVLSGDRHQGVILYYDKLEPVEAEIVVGMLQMAAGRRFFETMMHPLGGAENESPATTQSTEKRQLIKVTRHDVTGQRMKIAAKHTFLAGLVPMLLLFSSAGAARGLLEELGTGEIRRLLAAPIHPAHVLLAQMASATFLAVVQCYVLYFYGWLVFHVAIWSITVGLLALTISTSLAVTSFGLFLGSFCKRPEQLDSIGTTVILAMSAVGGSMVPRWIMPEWMKDLGLFTINGWAYDGFMKLIQNQGLSGIAPQCGTLLAIAAVSAAVGCALLARRLKASPPP